ncbi:alpha/beta fold hydrolase [Limimaricola pyoseonensis]|uniref:Pimeloyl-ACP methyl ester carboxylesterase n=1 Tax=Limimaricola pyoseonensis TaxID=521013 RepID=A0A1G7AIA0_9RHOB|nr:alpha/beta hydrolase [Limimaricola pyoseonensis]SDE13606.1 Pimeloyl-ACP methyl ester carboxylesterase [Limimaricola pyoseonensis]
MAVKLAALLALTALGGCALVDHRADRREARALEAYPPIGAFVEVAGRKVHAVVTGEGPDLVLIHGASGNLRDMTFQLAERLSERYRVIAFDRPGLGYSDPIDPRADDRLSSRADSPAAQARVLQAAAAQLGAEKPVVVGHSYGGAVAMAWALERPDNLAALVNLSGATMPWESGLGPLYRFNGTTLGGAVLPPLITAFASERAVGDTLDAIFRPNPIPEGYAEFVGTGLAIRRSSLRVNARQVTSLLPQVTEMSARYGAISVPVEIVHGEIDTIVPLEVHSARLEGLVPGANLTVLEDVGHMPHHVAPAHVVAAIDRAARRAGLL